MRSLPDDRTILNILEPLALSAGARIMEILRAGCAAEIKTDASPVTRADREAEEVILGGLREQLAGVSVVAEEEDAAGIAPSRVGDVFFLVDPLDGTREFVRGGDDFTVNIGLVRDGEPVVGVVYAPVRRVLYCGRPGSAEAVSADEHHRPIARSAIEARRPGRPLVIVASRSHLTPETERFIRHHPEAECVNVGSSLKFCMLACGEADLYPRFGRTMQWDTAAGDAVLRAAGGMTRALDGSPFRYGPGTAPGDAPFANPDFIAEGRPPQA